MKPSASPGQPSPRRPGSGSVAAGLAAALAMALPGVAHDVFTAYIQHRVGLVVGAQHVDVTVQLTFFEDGSEHERQHMDTNGDGQLSRAETEAYLRRLEPHLTEAVTLRVAGQAVRLVPLREPELDLLGNTRVGRGHHRLTLFFFASTPTNLVPGAELVVGDRLWPEVRALATLQVQGQDHCHLEAVPFDDPVLPPARQGEARQFKARVVAPPAQPRPNGPLPAQPDS